MFNCAAILLAATVAVAQADGEKAFKSYAETAVGVWTTTADNGRLEISYRWVANKRFLQLTAKGGVLPFVAMIGVHPETKKCTWWFFNEDGGIGTGVLTQEADGVWLLENKGIGPKGEIRYKGKLTRVDANTVKEEVTEFVVYGEKQKMGTLIWARKP